MSQIEAGAGSEIVSVITVCRNAEAGIEATMISVLKQTYPAIEYIVIDGLSSDRTLDIVRKTAHSFPHRIVKVISEPDHGIADAMNKGVLNANGVLIAHLHAGDRYIHDRVIERVIDSFRREQWRWAVAESVAVDLDGRTLHLYRPRLDYRLLLSQNFIPHQSTFLIRDIFLQNGMFRTDLKQGMDYEFWLRICFKGGEHYRVLPFATTYYQHGGRSSRLFELIRYLYRIRRDLRSWGIRVGSLRDFVFFSKIIGFAGLMWLKSRRAIPSWLR